MPTQTPKPRKPGRPKLPKGEGKGSLIAIRLNIEDHKKAAAAAKSLNQTLSQWIRDLVNTSLID